MISIRNQYRSWVLPLGINFASMGHAGWELRIEVWKCQIVFGMFDWPFDKMLLNCNPHYLLPCIKRCVGGIYGTPHGDFFFNSIQICWWNKSWQKDLTPNPN